MMGHNSGFFKIGFIPDRALSKFTRKNIFNLFCAGLLKDKDKNLWIATSRGLFRQNRKRS
jgi:ligand-binding sensor domain-containing protein